MTDLAAQESVTYTFKVAADGNDCVVEAYDSAEDPYYLSTTSQKTGWTVPDSMKDTLTNAGKQETGVLKVGNIYAAKVEYDGMKITITYTDLGTDGSGTTVLFTTSTTGTVTAPVHAHLVAQFGTFTVKTEKGASNE